MNAATLSSVLSSWAALAVETPGCTHAMNTPLRGTSPTRTGVVQCRRMFLQGTPVSSVNSRRAHSRDDSPSRRLPPKGSNLHVLQSSHIDTAKRTCVDVLGNACVPTMRATNPNTARSAP